MPIFDINSVIHIIYDCIFSYLCLCLIVFTTMKSMRMMYQPIPNDSNLCQQKADSCQQKTDKSTFAAHTQLIQEQRTGFSLPPYHVIICLFLFADNIISNISLAHM